MDEKQFKTLMEELITIKKLLILSVSKGGATSDEVGKCIGVSGSSVRKVLAGIK